MQSSEHSWNAIIVITMSQEGIGPRLRWLIQSPNVSTKPSHLRQLDKELGQTDDSIKHSS